MLEKNVTKTILKGLAAIVVTGALMGSRCNPKDDESCNSMSHQSSALKRDYSNQNKTMDRKDLDHKGADHKYSAQDKNEFTPKNLDKEFGFYESALSADGCRDGCYKTNESSDYVCCWCDD